MLSKRGISAIVATVLIILITVAAITILWVAVVPMIQTNLEFSELESRLTILNGEYTAYDAAEEIAIVQVKRDFDDVVMEKIRITFSIEGGGYSTIVDAPEAGAKKVYTFNLTGMGVPDSVSVAPIFIIKDKEKEGKVTSEVDLPAKEDVEVYGEVYDVNDNSGDSGSGTPAPATCTDNDGDGYGPDCDLGSDCDDGNASINPGMEEICGNEIDEDCDGVASECAGGVLLFQSGFEDNTIINAADNIEGLDLSAPSGMNNWSKIVDYLGWVVETKEYLQGGMIEISENPTDPDDKVLHFHNQYPEGEVSRTQWTIKQVPQWIDNGEPNLFDKQFYRYRMYIPSDIKNAIPFNVSAPWYMIWESHAWELETTRYAIHLFKPEYGNWYFRAKQERPEGGTILWENSEHQYIDVPFDEWFTFEVFFKYHEEDGEFYFAIIRDEQPRQVAGHYTGQTKFDTKLHDQMMFKMYMSSSWFDWIPDGTHQYHDDFEIWSDYPSGYWEEEYCGNGICGSSEDCSFCPADCGVCPSQIFIPEQIAEAENGFITFPTKIADYTGASGEKYIYSAVSDTGSASYTFNIAEEGQYYMQARVFSPSAGSNSFYVGLDEGPTDLTYGLPVTTNFIWDNVSTYESDPVIWSLEPGEHNFTFYCRESNTLLDSIILHKVVE